MGGNKMKNVDVLYIHPPALNNKAEYLYIPTGIIGLLNLLSDKGFEVVGVNIPLEKLIDQTFSIESYLRSIDAKITMIDLHWSVHSYDALNIAKYVKSINPNTKTILGGYTASLFATEIMSKFKYIDYIIYGDAEKPLCELVSSIVKNKSEKDLKNIPNIIYRSKECVKRSNSIWHMTKFYFNQLNYGEIKKLFIGVNI